MHLKHICKSVVISHFCIIVSITKRLSTVKNQTMSDSASSDSDEGIRYKTESVRNKSGISKRKKSYSPSTSHRKTTTSSSSNYKEKLTEDHCFGPKLPPRFKPTGTTVSPVIEPSLSPHLIKSNEDYTKNVDSELNQSNYSPFGPALPQHLSSKTKNSPTQLNPTESRDPEATLDPVIGPSLPPHLLKTKEDQTENADSECTKLGQCNFPFSPALPQHLSEYCGTAIKVVQPVVGPSLPPHLVASNTSEVIIGPAVVLPQPNIIGPALPDHIRMQLKNQEEESSETIIDIPEDVYGPLPPNLAHYSGAHRALEERALEMKINQLGPRDADQPVRETWMLELPEAKAARFGLGPRQFRSKAGPDLSDRSSWTAIPGEKNKQKSKKDESHNLKQDAELRESRKRDKEQEKFAKKQKRDEKSLLDIHKEKRDKEKKDAGPAERRPFNRETDLQVNRFDEAQRKAVMKKAQLLDDRFSSGKSKYL